MAFHIWLTFALTYIILTITPGPNVALVIRNSLNGRKLKTLLSPQQ